MKVAEAVRVIVLFVVFAQLVDCIISQVHIHVAHVFLIWKFIWCGCKSDETIIVNVDSQRIYAVEQDINSKIKFEAIYQQRVGDIVLRNDVIVRVDILKVARQENSLAL
jgi:hypothetical protein